MMSQFTVPTVERVLFSTSMTVKISDINYGNHLGHDALISLLHEARVRFLKQHGFTELNINGTGILVTTLLVNYVGEAFYGDELMIEIGVGETTRISTELLYSIYKKNTSEKIALALTTLTFFDYAKRKVSRIPQEFLSSIK
jgi:acyl-CoA thioester hydrolase